MVFTTADIEKRIVKAMPTAVESNSFLTRAGATSISYNTTDVRRAGIGGAAFVEEGGVKPVSDTAAAEWSVQQGKLVYAHIATDEYMDDEEGRAEMTKLVAASSRFLTVSSDILIATGNNPANGNNIARLDDYNLYETSLENVATAATGAANVAAIQEALSVAESPEKIVLSPLGFSSVAYAKAQNGTDQAYPLADRNGTFDFWATDAFRAKYAGANGILADPVTGGSKIIPNDVVAYLGDFSGIGRAFGALKVRILREATIGGVSLGETNQVAYLIEQTVRWVLSSPDAISVVKAAA